MSQLRIYKNKSRPAVVVKPDKSFPGLVIAKNLFAKNADVKRIIGLKLISEAGSVGVIKGTFGNTGKLKARCAVCVRHCVTEPHTFSTPQGTRFNGIFDVDFD